MVMSGFPKLLLSVLASHGFLFIVTSVGTEKMRREWMVFWTTDFGFFNTLPADTIAVKHVYFVINR